MTEHDLLRRLECCTMDASEISRIVSWARALRFDQHAMHAIASLASLGHDVSASALRAYLDMSVAFGMRLDTVADAVIDACVGEFGRLESLGILVRTQGNQCVFEFQGTDVSVRRSRDEIESHILSLADRFRGAHDAQQETIGWRLTYN